MKVDLIQSRQRCREGTSDPTSHCIVLQEDIIHGGAERREVGKSSVQAEETQIQRLDLTICSGTNTGDTSPLEQNLALINAGTVAVEVDDVCAVKSTGITIAVSDLIALAVTRRNTSCAVSTGQTKDMTPTATGSPTTCPAAIVCPNRLQECADCTQRCRIAIKPMLFDCLFYLFIYFCGFIFFKKKKK